MLVLEIFKMYAKMNNLLYQFYALPDIPVEVRDLSAIFCAFWLNCKCSKKNQTEQIMALFGLIVYNRAIVYKRQNFFKVVVHVIALTNVIKLHVRQNPGIGYCHAILVAMTSECCW